VFLDPGAFLVTSVRQTDVTWGPGNQGPGTAPVPSSRHWWWMWTRPRRRPAAAVLYHKRPTSATRPPGPL